MLERKRVGHSTLVEKVPLGSEIVSDPHTFQKGADGVHGACLKLGKLCVKWAILNRNCEFSTCSSVKL